MNPAWIIRKKRDGLELTPSEIEWFIQGLETKEVTDYQASAWLMAVYFNGMSLNETVTLTQAMAKSGVQFKFDEIDGPKVDKHSTGGVGDKVSLILAPLAAACGLKVPMMSGRGLGHTGGTLDKLESISGFNVQLSEKKIHEQLNELGCVMIGQSQKMVPADKKLYSIRDVTATVECIPLIVASILSKKIAEGCDALLLDVKVGSGAFMKTKGQAKALATQLVRVSRKLGLPSRALLTDMSQPLGYAVGNSVEMIEAIEVLRNTKRASSDFTSADLKELTIQLCAQMVVLGKLTRSLTQARKLVHERLSKGRAWEIFREMVRSQGGDVSQIEEIGKLPRQKKILKWRANKKGYLNRIHTDAVGRIVVELGGGRKKASDAIDPSVGLLFHKKLGTLVRENEPIVSVLAHPHSDISALEKEFFSSIEIGKVRKTAPRLVLEVIS